MTKKIVIATAAPFFETYPTVNQFFITSDGQVFEHKHDAHNHAKTFQLPANQVVTKVTRDEGAEDTEAVVVATPVIVVPQGTVVKIDTGGNTAGQSDYKLTADDLDKNPSLADQNLKTGDIIKVPAKELENTGANTESADKNYVAPKAPEEQEKIEQAKEKLAEATKSEGTAAQSFNDAPANMRGLAKMAWNKAQTALQDAKDELAALMK